MLSLASPNFHILKKITLLGSVCKVKDFCGLSVLELRSEAVILFCFQKLDGFDFMQANWNSFMPPFCRLLGGD